jgi:hypothetical protein
MNKIDFSGLEKDFENMQKRYLKDTKDIGYHWQCPTKWCRLVNSRTRCQNCGRDVNDKRYKKPLLILNEKQLDGKEALPLPYPLADNSRFVRFTCKNTEHGKY